MNAPAQALRNALNRVETISDWLGVCRLLLAPVLWVLALTGKKRSVGVGIAVSAVTDVLDGAVARVSGERSEFGGQLDSIADMAIIVSSPGWMALLYPDVLRRRRTPLLTLSGVAVLLLAIEWGRYHKLGALHIDSARAAAVVGHGYVLDLFLREHDSDALFRLFTILSAGAAIESAWVILIRESLDDLSETPFLDRLSSTLGLPNPLALRPFHDPARSTP